MLLQVERKGPFAPLKAPVIETLLRPKRYSTSLLPRAQSGTKRVVEVRCTGGRIKKIGLLKVEEPRSAPEGGLCKLPFTELSRYFVQAPPERSGANLTAGSRLLVSYSR